MKMAKKGLNQYEVGTELFKHIKRLLKLIDKHTDMITRLRKRIEMLESTKEGTANR